METEDYVINLDEKHTIKRVKSKDTDNDMLLEKKEQVPMLKEVDKKTATCSSI